MKVGHADFDLKKMFHGATTVGERGQVVIPAAARRELGIEPGDKLLVFQHPVGPSLMLTKTEALRAMVDEWLGQWSALREIFDKEAERDEK